MNPKNKLFVLFSIIGLITFLLYLSSSLYQILALSIIMAYFMNPLKKYLFKRLRNESLASAVSMLAGFLVLSAVLLIFFSSVYNSLLGIALFTSEFKNFEIFTNTQSVFESFNIEQSLTSAGVLQLAEIFQNLLFLTPQTIISIIIFLFMLFYFIKYSGDLLNIIRGIVPPTEMKYFDIFINKVDVIMKAIFRGQLITALVQSLILFAFLLILNIPYSFEMTFLTFLFCFFGITSAIVPIGLNIFFLYQGIQTGDFLIFFITLGFTFFITTMDNIIKPLIGEKQANFNPVFFLLGLIAGALTLGLTGIIIGPLLYGMFQVSLEVYFSERNLKFV